MSIRLAFVASVLVIPSAAFGQQAVQWRVEDGGNGHWYQGVALSSVQTLDSGQAYCVQRGGHLVAITTAAEWNFVDAVANQDALWGGYFVGPLIGLKVDGGGCIEGCWVTGEPVDFTNWHGGNPDFPATDNCVFLFQRPVRDWQNHPCGMAGWGYYCRSLIIEWSADCDKDGIVDYGQILDGTHEDANSNGVPDCCEGIGSCEPCYGDVTGNGYVDGLDLAAVLGAWGTSGKGEFPTDRNGDGSVDAQDLALVLSGWGACP